MATRTVDSNIRDLIADLAVLTNRLREVRDVGGQRRLTLTVSAFLLVNTPIIQRAVEAWDATPEQELKVLDGDHRELDQSATHRAFRDIALEPVRYAHDVLGSPAGLELLGPDDDQLHMLSRLLEFAKYLAQTSDLNLRWSPVARVLDTPDADALVNAARAMAVADLRPGIVEAPRAKGQASGDAAERTERDESARTDASGSKTSAPPEAPVIAGAARWPLDTPAGMSFLDGRAEDAARASRAAEAELEAPSPDADESHAVRDEAPTPRPAGTDYRPSATISRDYWTVDDRLGYDFYADAVAAFIQHRDTRPPLTIGIKAPWGAGKTSLMRMVRQRLDPDLTSELNPRAASATISNKEVLEHTRVARDDRRVPIDDLQASADEDQRPTVWFNAWMYQSAEQVWAGLGDAIIGQLTLRMPRIVRERFWAQLNLRRVDTALVRRRIYRALLERLLPFALGLTVAWTISLGLLFIPGSREAAGALGIGSVAVFAAGAVAKSRKFLNDPVAGSFGELVSEPDYKGKAGYLHHVRSDMDRVLDLVATPEQPVVVFVDDLDRCSYQSVAQVIEAINLFLAGEFPNCIFVIAMEPDMVAAQIEVAYKDLFETVKGDLSAREQGQLGWRFLEKMVQLPLSLPPPNKTQVEAFVSSLLVGEADEEMFDASSVESARQMLHETMRRLGADPPIDRIGAISEAAKQLYDAPGIAEEDVIRAAEAEFSERFRDDDPIVQEAIRSQATTLSSNPREIKRYINVFRFYAFIQVRRDLRQLETPSYEQLAKLSALAIHWPHLLGLFGQSTAAGSSVLDELERLAIRAKAGDDADESGVVSANGRNVWLEGIKAAGFPEGRSSDLAAQDLRTLLAQEPMIGSSASGFL